MKGNHLEDNCWTKYPEKRPRPYTPNKKDKKDKGRGRSRSRDKSVEKDDRKKRGASPYPIRVVRAKDRFTDRDSEESGNEESVKELEREYQETREKAKEIEKKIKRTRRVRTGASGRIFSDEITEAQYNRMEREAARGQGPSRNIRRVKKQVICSLSSRGAAPSFTEQSLGLGDRNIIHQWKKKKTNLKLRI